MKKLLFAPALAAGLVLLGACADMRWTKSGADEATVSRDLDQCRAAALRRAAPPAAGTVAADPQVSVERAGVPAGNRSVAGSANERFIAEHESIRVCMTGRGYQLELR